MMTGREILREGQPTEQKEPTLIESFNGIYLTRSERTAGEILDSFPELTLIQKRMLFDVFVWHETGSIAPLKKFGDVREDKGEILDRVFENDELVGLYDEFYFRYSETLVSKRKQQALNLIAKGEPAEEVAEELELGVSNIRDLLNDLVKDRFVPRKRKEKKIPEKRKIIERSERYKPYLELRSGVAQLRLVGGRRHTEQEIANILTSRFQRKITVQQVKRQIRMLIADGIIKDRSTKIDREKQKEQLASCLKDSRFLDEEGNVVFWRILRTGNVTNDFRTLVSLYEELAMEGEVPPRKLKGPGS